ncbi:hypothetical protein ABID92_001109 [Frigoribacterium sp. PvP120]|jgi:hypothetical protein|uniref:hypothetical protein n=1 Tax=Frigoribacterium TaxID=96492 RepID=UPI00141E3FF5|nr:MULTISPECIES: hypothetical protein [Frigoribacterium]MBD8658773.1 hypothetical protein [Frigoribacterium sp. CFBP 8754]MBD8727066.1 hypothetical protein [Frigoribacterium sp. CFBP 13707]MBP1241074.1 hypothetical protein [Frigoribacterium sp. PvP121]NII49955.1 hypothetical protein [Frigoribacterium endophyticum]QNE44606.1 hypothetical protein F1C15_12970 [Frigoribacterium sp. NBH87]
MRHLDRSSLVRTTLGVVAAGALAFTLVACSSTSDSESNNTAPTHPVNEPDEREGSSVAETPAASVPSLAGGVDTQVAVDASFVDALGTLGLTPGVVGTATFTGGTFSFPITGGNVDYYGPDSEVRPYVQGFIEHDGSGLSLTAADGTVVELTDFDIDPGESKLYGDVTVDGTVAAEHAYLFNLWGGTLEPLRTEGSNAVLEGTTVHVSPAAASLLNETFGTEAVEDEMLVGVATITVATQ